MRIRVLFLVFREGDAYAALCMVPHIQVRAATLEELEALADAELQRVLAQPGFSTSWPAVGLRLVAQRLLDDPEWARQMEAAAPKPGDPGHLGHIAEWPRTFDLEDPPA